VTLTVKIERVSANGETRFFLSGELRSEEVEQVNAEIASISPTVALDCAELWVVDSDGLRWLKACEAVGVKVENCAPYIREWMLQEKS
jgi:ABC-type transporter Mla MlaB component